MIIILYVIIIDLNIYIVLKDVGYLPLSQLVSNIYIYFKKNVLLVMTYCLISSGWFILIEYLL